MRYTNEPTRAELEAGAWRVIGWTKGDGSGHDGYNVADYFGPDGRYLGPDRHGIQPIFTAIIGSTS